MSDKNNKNQMSRNNFDSTDITVFVNFHRASWRLCASIIHVFFSDKHPQDLKDWLLVGYMFCKIFKLVENDIDKRTQQIDFASKSELASKMGKKHRTFAAWKLKMTSQTFMAVILQIEFFLTLCTKHCFVVFCSCSWKHWRRFVFKKTQLSTQPF